MDVYEQAKVEAATLTDRELRRGFRHAAAKFREYCELYDMEMATFSYRFVDIMLDEWLRRRR